MDSLLWYDLETFGTDPARDRISQFAARRTDLELNPVGEPVNLLCRQATDYLPSPAAALVTGLTPQRCERGLNESAFAEATGMRLPWDLPLIPATRCINN